MGVLNTPCGILSGTFLYSFVYIQGTILVTGYSTLNAMQSSGTTSPQVEVSGQETFAKFLVGGLPWTERVARASRSARLGNLPTSLISELIMD